MRLDKFLAQGAIGTRKEVREYIKEALVKVNGKVETEGSKEINEKEDEIFYLDKKVKYIDKKYYMFNKPAGSVTAIRDKGFKTVFDYFKDVDTKGLFHVGRLDKDTEGLLLITNDGDFEHKIMHPSKKINKTYFFWALGTITEEKKTTLENGLDIGQSERVITAAATFKLGEVGFYNELKNKIPITEIENLKSDKFNQPVFSGYLTISEGKKHQVKRMLKAIDCYIIYLKRVAIGNVILDENLHKGEFRSLKIEEISSLLK
ncbi:MAG: pseudouridine synthase [Sarcina sp.]